MFYALPAPPASYVSLSFDCRLATLLVSEGFCPPKILRQPELRDAIVAEVLETRYDSTFPFICAAGVYGSRGAVDEQRGPDCSGRCPAGHECPTQTTTPTPCSQGTFCPIGSAKANACMGGTYSDMPMLVSPGGCHRVGAGFYAPRGSGHPMPCPDGDYRCPGALDVLPGDEDSESGVVPIRLSTGSTTRTEHIITEIDALTWPLTLTATDEEAAEVSTASALTAVSKVIGALLAIPPELMTVEEAPTPSRTRSRRMANEWLTLQVTMYMLPQAIDASVLTEDLADLTGTALSRSLAFHHLPVTSVTLSEPMLLRSNFSLMTQVEDPCPPGFWCTTGKRIACSAGTYNPHWWNSTAFACLPCPLFSTSTVATSKGSHCFCIQGYFDLRTSYSEDSRAQCELCPSGTQCAEANTTISSLPLRVGYYRISPLTVDVQMCPDATANCTLQPNGTYGLCTEGTSACRGGPWRELGAISYNESYGDDIQGSNTSEISEVERRQYSTIAMSFQGGQCPNGLHGPFCQLCNRAERPDLAMHFVSASKEAIAHCTQCKVTSVLGADGPIMLGMLGLFLLLVAVAMFAWNRFASADFKTRMYDWLAVMSLKPKLKQLYGFYSALAMTYTPICGPWATRICLLTTHA